VGDLGNRDSVPDYFHLVAVDHKARMSVNAMRLILIDNNSGLIFGDTANYLLARLNDWRENNTDNNSDAARLSPLAARLLDDSIRAWA
jgi:hypothetical protein